MINLIQPITVQQAYDGITHARRWASWNWWWRMVDDDDGDESPSPEPRTDSRSALPREIRAWRWLRIVKRVETVSLIFFLRETEYVELELRSVERQGAHETGGAPRGEGAPPPSWTRCGPPGLDSFASIFYIFQKVPPWIFRTFRELFFSTHKTTSWQFCWKQRQSGLVSFKSCKLESKTRAKVFGKVDTTETYQLPQA